ncbi:uncharacterized protein LOC136749914 [Amia ocellicauda]|uniref:uncharacterized protein LOC136749906 n=1 Tax=Amia ocellicauda TaxID=2972642 RepID=UPI0034643273
MDSNHHAADVTPHVRSNIQRRKKLNHKDKELIKKKLVKSGTVFIIEFFKQWKAFKEKKPNVTNAYFVEVLHCIFFLGYIHERQDKKKPIEPREFFSSDGIYERFQKLFPQAFEQYRTHWPTRTPFSILLDLVTKWKGCSNHTAILKHLEDIRKGMVVDKNKDDQCENNYCLVASVISVCYFQEDMKRSSPIYYGASLSCSGRVETQVMITLSCIKTWNDAVAHAVWHGKSGNIIRLPNGVICMAYKMKLPRGSYLEESPCVKCHRIFQNIDFIPVYTESDKTQDWHYGNCAENESLSNLLNGEERVRNETVAYRHYEEQDSHSLQEQVPLDRAEIVNQAKKKAAQLLNSRGFKIKDDEIESKFFHPN